MYLATNPAKGADRVADAAVIGGNGFPEILRIEAHRQGR